MDQTTLAASLTIITKDLRASSESAWIAGAYFLTSTSFQLLYGRLSDIWSRKVLLVIGIWIFFFGSLAASLAQTSLQLIVFRAFTGVGGGGLMTVAQLIVSDIVPLRERGKYQGILEMDLPPELVSERLHHWMRNLLHAAEEGERKLEAVSDLAVAESEANYDRKLVAIDFFGVVLALAGSTLLVLALTWAGGEYAWSSVHVITTLVVGIATMAGFVLWQWKGTKVPLVTLSIFTSKLVNGAVLTMFVNGWNFLVQIYYIPSFYQLVYGYSAVKSGALLLPITLTQTLFSTLSGLVVHRTGRYRECLLIGWAVWAIGLGLISTLSSPSLGQQIGYGLLAGFGLGNTLQPSLIAVQAGVERKHMAVVTSFRNFIRNLGGTLGLAISGTIINSAVRSSLAPYGLSRSQVQLLLDSPDRFEEANGGQEMDALVSELSMAYQKGFRVVFIVGAVLNAVAFVAAWVLMPQVELARPDDEELKEEGKRWGKKKVKDRKGRGQEDAQR
ncbi:hypothetical protein SLS61_001194 [Didymella pomorum]